MRFPYAANGRVIKSRFGIAHDVSLSLSVSLSQIRIDSDTDPEKKIAGLLAIALPQMKAPLAIHTSFGLYITLISEKKAYAAAPVKEVDTWKTSGRRG
jgi:hypothetical protein